MVDKEKLRKQQYQEFVAKVNGTVDHLLTIGWITSLDGEGTTHILPGTLKAVDIDRIVQKFVTHFQQLPDSLSFVAPLTTQLLPMYAFPTHVLEKARELLARHRGMKLRGGKFNVRELLEYFQSDPRLQSLMDFSSADRRTRNDVSSLLTAISTDIALLSIKTSKQEKVIVTPIIPIASGLVSKSSENAMAAAHAMNLGFYSNYRVVPNSELHDVMRAQGIPTTPIFPQYVLDDNAFSNVRRVTGYGTQSQVVRWDRQNSGINLPVMMNRR